MKRTLDVAAIVLTALLLLGFAVLSVRGYDQSAGRLGPVSARRSPTAAGALFYPRCICRAISSSSSPGAGPALDAAMDAACHFC